MWRLEIGSLCCWLQSPRSTDGARMVVGQKSRRGWLGLGSYLDVLFAGRSA